MAERRKRSATGSDAPRGRSSVTRVRSDTAADGASSERLPIAPYMAVGLSTVVHGIGSRAQIERNLAIIEDGIHAAVSIIGINMPVKLIALAEGALTGLPMRSSTSRTLRPPESCSSTFPDRRPSASLRSLASTRRISSFNARRAGPR